MARNVEVERKRSFRAALGKPDLLGKFHFRVDQYRSDAGFPRRLGARRAAVAKHMVPNRLIKHSVNWAADGDFGRLIDMSFQLVVVFPRPMSHHHSIDEIPKRHAAITPKSFIRAFSTSSSLDVPAGFHLKWPMFWANDDHLALVPVVLHFVVNVIVIVDLPRPFDKLLV
jgi:hypothetical protein